MTTEFPTSMEQKALLAQIRARNPSSLSRQTLMIPIVVEPYDDGAFRRAVDQVVRRHELLRSRLVGHGLDRLLTDVDVPEVGEARSPEPDEAGSLLLTAVRRPFALDERLMRVSIVRVGAGTAMAVLCYHHLIGDSLSSSMLLADLRAAYEAELRGRTDGVLRPVRGSYRQHAEEQARWTASFAEALEGQPRWKAFIEHLGRAPAVAPTWRLPNDPQVTADAGEPSIATARVRIAGDALAVLADGGRRLPVAAAAHEASVLQIVLHAWSGLDLIPLLFVKEERHPPELAEVVGLFIDVLRLTRRFGDDDWSATGVMRENAADIRRFISARMPAFAVAACNPRLGAQLLAGDLVMFQSLGRVGGASGGSPIRLLETDAHWYNDAATLVAQRWTTTRHQDALDVAVQYDPQRWSRRTMETLLARFGALLVHTAQHPTSNRDACLDVLEPL